MYLVIIHQKNDFIEKTGRFLLEKEKQGSNKKKKKLVALKWIEVYKIKSYQND